MSTDICTSIEQSKKLLSLGIDPSTADMWYSYYGNSKYNPTVAYKGQQWFLCQIRNSSHDDIPCWSLTALLKLLPDIIKVKEECYTFSLIKNVIEYVGHDGSILYSTGGESFVDTAVKMFELIDKDKNILHYVH